MPLQKRIVFDPASYHKKDVFEESTQESFLQDHNMSKMLGTMQQLAYFSSFALEIFQNLAILSEDLSDRIKSAASRTDLLYSQLKQVDRKVASIDDESHMHAIPGMPRYLQSREMFTPQLFNKATNYCSISHQYRVCRAPPQLWRVEVFTEEDCFRNFSNPGYFFQEWIRSEILRQQAKKEEKKKAKLLKKLQRQERKKLKEAAADAEEEELLNTIYSSPSVSANASANVSLSGVTDKRNKSMLVVRSGRSVDSDRNSAAEAEGAGQPHSEEVEEGPPEESVEEKSAEEIAADAAAAALAAKKSKAGKEKSKGAAAAAKGLAHLFGRKPKPLFPSVEDEGADGARSGEDEPAPSKPPAPLQKTESVAKQLLSAMQDRSQRGKGARSPSADREELEEGDQGERDGEEAELREAAAPAPAPRPLTYMDELAAAAGTTRRHSVLVSKDRAAMADSGRGVVSPTATTALSEEEGMGERILRINAEVAARRGKHAPAATMKIGKKFLSSAPAGGKKVGSSKGGELVEQDGDAQVATGGRRGSTRVNLVSDSMEGLAGRAHSGSADWGTQRLDSSSNLLLKPSPALLAAAATDKAGVVGGKRTSFSANTKGGEGEQSRLLPGKHRASFALPHSAHSSVSSDMFDRAQSYAEDSGQDGGFGSSGTVRRKSLLSMLQEEVLEGLAAHQEAENEAEGEAAPDDVETDEAPDDVEEEELGADGEPDDAPAEEEGPEEDRDSPPVSDDEPGPGEEEPIEESPPPSPRPSARAGAPPPPPPPPPPAPMKSALGEGLLGALRSGMAGSTLKKVEPPPEAKVDDRVHLLRSIQLGSAQLKSAAQRPASKPFQKIEVKQNEAVAAILANRSKIAGSDSESSDDSDSEYTDDDY